MTNILRDFYTNKSQMSRQSNLQEPAEPPLQVGDYRLEKVIGQGTYGKVRLGAHIETGENVIIFEFEILIVGGNKSH